MRSRPEIVVTIALIAIVVPQLTAANRDGPERMDVPSAPGGGDSPVSLERAWNGEVQVYGSLRGILHEGRTGPVVSLDGILPDPHVDAVGALADLAGEITVVGGTAYLSYPEGADGARTERTSRTTAAATLLVVAQVPAWRGVATEGSIPFEEIDEAIATLATAAGINLDAPFPFRVEGDVEDLRWHVIDGRRLAAGRASHEDHRSAAVRMESERTPATLVGVYSGGEPGAFTHRGSRTHIHCVIEEPLAAGHVDHVAIPAGATVWFPFPGVERRVRQTTGVDP